MRLMIGALGHVPFYFIYISMCLNTQVLGGHFVVHQTLVKRDYNISALPRVIYQSRVSLESRESLESWEFKVSLDSRESLESRESRESRMSEKSWESRKSPELRESLESRNSQESWGFRLVNYGVSILDSGF